MQSGKLSAVHLVFYFLGGLVLLFLIAPIVGMYLHAKAGDIITAVNDKEVSGSIWLTLWVAMVATLIFSVAAVPFAWILARKNFFGKRFISGMIDLPLVIPHSAAGIAILGFVSRESWLGKGADLMGIQFVGSAAGIAVAMAFVSLPYLINAARNGFEAVPQRLEKAALTLGAKPFRVFLTISLPLAGRSIISGLIMMFARGMSEFGAVIIVAYHPMITPVLIFESFESFGLHYARAISVLFVTICFIVFILFRWIAKNKTYAED